MSRGCLPPRRARILSFLLLIGSPLVGSTLGQVLKGDCRNGAVGDGVRRLLGGTGDTGAMLTHRGAGGCLALELPPAAAGPAREELLEVFLVGGQARSEAVRRLLVTLTCPQPTEAADAGTQGTLANHGPVGDVELVAVQHRLAAELLQLPVAAIMRQAASVSVIHGGPFAPKTTVAAISIIREEGAPPCDVFDHPLKLPEAAVGRRHQAGGEDHKNPKGLHSRGHQGVRGTRIAPSSAS